MGENREEGEAERGGEGTPGADEQHNRLRFMG